MTDTELKPCLRCGDSHVMHFPSPWNHVQCRNCGLTQGKLESASSIELWNTRPVEDALRKERDELRVALKRLLNAQETTQRHQSRMYLTQSGEGYESAKASFEHWVGNLASATAKARALLETEQGP